MPEKLKDLFFSKRFIEQLAEAIQQIYPDFDKEKLLQAVYDEGWEDRELKARMRHLSHCLHVALPPDYPEALALLLKVAPLFEEFDAMVFPDYVECYGLGDWERSLPALALFTRQASSEFAIRPFLALDP
jgi:3-methyladenine DNA glycosylase AlkC